jgi:hypothetical protein
MPRPSADGSTPNFLDNCTCAQIGASLHAYAVRSVQGLEKLQGEKIFALVQDRSSIIVIFHFS